MAGMQALARRRTPHMVPHENPAMSYGALGAVNGSAKFVSSTAAGMVWTAVSPVLGFGLAVLLMGAEHWRYCER